MTRIVNPLPTVKRQHVRGRLEDEGGFGLIEMVVSIMLLALLSVMFLPLLIQGLKISAWNTTLATANQLVNQRLAAAQGDSPDCAAVIALFDTVDEQVIVVEDPRGIEIQVTTTVDPSTATDCPADVSDDLFVSVSSEAVRLDEPGRVLVAAETLVFVGLP